MRDIFIGRQAELLANWLEAFPDAEGVTSVSDILADSMDCLFWVHADGGQLESTLTTLELMRQRFGIFRAIVLANMPDQNEALLVFAQGASGYCHSLSQPAVLAQVRLVVCNGGVWLGQEVLQRLIAQGRNMVGTSSMRVQGLLAQLTAREREVALKAAEGLSNKEIAVGLAITERTVKAHLTSIFEQLHIRDRLQLALMLNDRTSR